MKYISDWDKRKERHNAFWQGEIVDRCLCTILGPKDNANFDPSILMGPTDPEEAMKYWTDGETVLKRNEHLFDNLSFIGDGFPQVFLNLGASGHALYFKGVPHHFGGSITFRRTEEELPSLIFEESNFWYQKTMDLAKYLANESKGDYFISMPDIAGNADVLAGIRGSDKFLMDMFLKESYIQPSMDKIQEVYKKTVNDVYDIVKDNNQGASGIGWLYTWAPGKHAQLQCDLSVMISPELYGEYIVPELREQTEFLDYSLYHFDGQEQRRHLDHLLSLDHLDAIQWTSVAGQPSALNYLDTLQKIQASGKKLLLHLPTPDEIEPLMQNLSSKGLHIVTHSYSEDHARSILDTVNKNTHE